MVSSFQQYLPLRKKCADAAEIRKIKKLKVNECMSLTSLQFLAFFFFLFINSDAFSYLVNVCTLFKLRAKAGFRLLLLDKNKVYSTRS